MAEEKSGSGAAVAAGGLGLGAVLLRLLSSGGDDLVRVGAGAADDVARLGAGAVDDVARAGGAGGAELGSLGDDLTRAGGAGGAELGSLGDDLTRAGSFGLGDDAGRGGTVAGDALAEEHGLAGLGDEPVADAARRGADDAVGHALDLAEAGLDAVDLAAPPDEDGRWIGAPRGTSALRDQLRVTPAGEVLGFAVRAAGERYRIGGEVVEAHDVARLCRDARRTCWVYVLPADAPWTVATDAWARSDEHPAEPAVGAVRTY